MAPSATLKSFTRFCRLQRHPHTRRQQRTAVVRRPVSLCMRSPADGATQRASTDQFSLRLSGHHKDCSRCPPHVFQRKCHHDAMSGFTLGSAAAAPGNSSILTCFWFRHERLRSCRALASFLSCASANNGAPASLSQTSSFLSTWDSFASRSERVDSGEASCSWKNGDRSKEAVPVQGVMAVFRLYSFQPQIFGGGLQWRGPSTHGMYCMQQDEDGGKDWHLLTMFCYQEEDTAEVVLLPKPACPTPQPAAHTPGLRGQRRLSRWAPPPSSATHSSRWLWWHHCYFLDAFTLQCGCFSVIL
ncbi:uncharacterized protein LOC142566844 isoform X1 [Dermacentor variabilis]|uniref:uncharacterized protein LOC142566844 isoform X1 n=1 Tax=Dermacentor variabilis TaxID=34621 RepID=UPI003F5B3B20